jgi:hypothetical protein
MDRRTKIAGLPGLLAVALLAAGCAESVGPNGGTASLAAPSFSHVGAGIALDQVNGSLFQTGPALVKGFNPTNPHRGDAVIATFFWLGSTNVITSVTDHLTNGTPVGNTYTLVEYVTAGGLSMATYVAKNVQNFPDPNLSQDDILVVRATLSQSVADGGLMISAWSGVDQVSAEFLGAHRSGSGSGSSITAAAPGSIAVGTGGLAYAVTVADGVVGSDGPVGFTPIAQGSDVEMKADAQYAVLGSVGSVDPQWTWFFGEPSTWLATVLTLNPSLRLGFTTQPSTTLPLVTMSPVRVTVLNSLGNAATSYNGPVTIAIGRNAGLLSPGTLSGTKTVNAVNGVATFSNLSIDQPGNGYTLIVTAAGIVSAESAPFNIGAF